MMYPLGGLFCCIAVPGLYCRMTVLQYSCNALLLYSLVMLYCCNAILL